MDGQQSGESCMTAGALFTALIHQFNKMCEWYRAVPPVEPPTDAQMERRAETSSLVPLPVATSVLAG